MKKHTKFGLLFAAGFALILAACTSGGLALRDETAKRTAAPAWMIKRVIATDNFALTAYERMHERRAPANLYIEGDGFVPSDLSDTTTLNPTPESPTALHLASKDSAENLVYLARPCQYIGTIDEDSSCTADYWAGKRFAPEVLAAYNQALNEIKSRYNITEFNVIGYDGGAAIAAILAAERDDVVSLRTVAGNLDHMAYSDYHKLPYMDESLNPTDYAQILANIPQHHYIGGQDTIITPTILHSYLQAVGYSSCVNYKFIQNAEHQRGWVNKWPEFLRESSNHLTCDGPMQDLGEPDITADPVYTSRMKPIKP
jgi:hypothetical protein